MGILNRKSLEQLGCVLALASHIYEDSGTYYVPDLSGQGHTATVSGGPIVRMGIDGQGIIYFDGTDDYLTIPDSPDWDMFSANFTICFWCKFTVVAETYIGIMGQSLGSTNTWKIDWQYNNNYLYIWGMTADSPAFQHRCTWTPVIDTWYFVAIERSGSSCLMYIDGVSQTVTADYAWDLQSTAIGADLRIGNTHSGSFWYPGYLRGPWIFKGTALDAAALTDLMNSTRPD